MAKKEYELTYVFENPNSPEQTESMLEDALVEKLLSRNSFL